jgi:hypothetical protein
MGVVRVNTKLDASARWPSGVAESPERCVSSLSYHIVKKGCLEFLPLFFKLTSQKQQVRLSDLAPAFETSPNHTAKSLEEGDDPSRFALAEIYAAHE